MLALSYANTQMYVDRIPLLCTPKSNKYFRFLFLAHISTFEREEEIISIGLYCSDFHFVVKDKFFII